MNEFEARMGDLRIKLRELEKRIVELEEGEVNKDTIEINARIDNVGDNSTLDNIDFINRVLMNAAYILGGHLAADVGYERVKNGQKKRGKGS